ncbi:LOW QUALITY PROTEIN: Eukaryotic/viral aspartic protease [Phytophthora megakarya]|uniref:Eukaryotic/viral aspartic protease n=1 Tax=Phytophthora megakarya TaxID=4795 RepID=A0A225UJA1_9STRA|nr:LOW QUALITY PROTEIN: Eukaryotic/viral aspartic protease [Phytophthora megakarya]
MGAIEDTLTRILLDTGANVSVISAAKRLRLREVSDHGRSLEVRGINPGVLETRRRALVKITLGWERVYEFEMWIMEHSAGVDVVLGTDFMIPAGVRLDLFHGTARLPEGVPLVKSANTVDDKPYGASRRWADRGLVHTTRVPTASKKAVASDTRVMDKKNKTYGTDGDGITQGQAGVGPSDERVGRDGSVL